ncbi:MAG: N-acetylglucosamine-6-phosphate deacetylase [Clostridia bacterium]|nr:N-acetylglucosamine-6-phosphate deacetylase [Clostridia bacterium]
MKYTLIENGELFVDRKFKKGNLLLCENKIAQVDFCGELPENTKIIDARGKYVSPGFIDIHLHGGGGYDFMDCTPEAFREISRTHLENGATTMIPTAVSSTLPDILRLFETYKASVAECPNFYGIHLEGPFISKNQKGAHNENILRYPTDEETQILLQEGKGIITRITAAPELCGMESFAKAMLENGVHLSIGHSDATSDIALDAMKHGFSHVTHLYSATPSVRKINQVVKAGVLEAAYLDDNVSVELIADGKHAAIHALQLAVKIKGVDKVCLVTDALRPAGTDATESWLGAKVPENRIIIEDGVAKLPDRSSFAGSIATVATVLEKGVRHYGISLENTLTMLTETPAAIMHLSNKGKIKDGNDADIVLFDKDLRVQNVFLGGEMVK